MSNYVSVIFCRVCNSRYVEIVEWTAERKSIIHCRTCNASEEIEKFTLGRCRISDVELQNARDTRAIPGKPER